VRILCNNLFSAVECGPL